MRCRDSARRLRTREAFGVRRLAGAFEERHSAPGATATSPLSASDRMGCSPEDVAQSRARFPPRPDGNDSMQGPVPPGPPHTAAARLRSPCAAATLDGASEVAEHLECASVRALSKEQHCARRPTAPPLSCRPVPRPTRLIAHPKAFTLPWLAFIPARGWVVLEQGGSRLKTINLHLQSSFQSQGHFTRDEKSLKTINLHLQSSFPPQLPRWPVAGRKPRLAPRVGRFSSKGCSSGFE